MATFFAETNNIRFYNPSLEANFNQYFPNFDNQIIGNQYYTDRNPIDYIREHIVNTPIIFQFRDSDDYKNVKVFKNGTEVINSDATDISPTAWTGIPVYKYSYTPTTTGIYHFEVTTTGYKSDDINVIAVGEKNIVKVSYYNSEDDLGTIFLNDAFEVIFNPTCFFSGFLNTGKQSSNKEIFEGDRKVKVLIKSSPISGYTLTLEAIHESYIEYINTIFSCDNLSVNGIECTVDGEIEKEQLGESDCYNLTIQLDKKNITHLRQ